MKSILSWWLSFEICVYFIQVLAYWWKSCWELKNSLISRKFKFVYTISCLILMGIFVSMIHSFFTLCSIDWTVLKIGINHSSYMCVWFIFFFMLFTISQTHKIEFHVNHSTSMLNKNIIKMKIKKFTQFIFFSQFSQQFSQQKYPVSN